MTKQLTIREYDGQVIVPTTDLAAWTAPNEFLAELVDRAEQDGEATAPDADGCKVTAWVDERE